MTLYQMAWVFAVYAFLGWCAEVVFSAVRTGQFINRGFLLGPVCPIYGLGVLFVLLVVAPFEDNILYLFFASMTITSALEFLVGWGAEKLLGQRLWDYRKMPFNIGGYICLAFSLMWALACIMVVRVFQPMILNMIGILPSRLGWTLLAVFFALLAADVILTLMDTLKLPRRMRAAEELAGMIRNVSDGMGGALYNATIRLDIPEKKDRILKEKDLIHSDIGIARDGLQTRITEFYRELGENRTYKRLTRSFPHLSGHPYNRHLKEIEEYLHTHRIGKKS